MQQLKLEDERLDKMLETYWSLNPPNKPRRQDKIKGLLEVDQHYRYNIRKLY